MENGSVTEISEHDAAVGMWSRTVLHLDAWTAYRVIIKDITVIYNTFCADPGW